MSVRTRGWSPKIQGRISQPGKLLEGNSPGEGKVALPLIHHDQPRASSRINDNYSIAKLQTGLLAGSIPQEQTMNTLNANFPVVQVATTVPGHSQKKDLSPGPAVCYYKESKLKFVKSVSCVTQLSCVNPVTNVRNAALNLPVGARLQNF